MRAALRLLLPLLLACAGCNTPAPRFLGFEPMALTEGPSRFIVWRDGTLVEVLRVSPEALPAVDAVALRAARAVRRATGCAVAWSRGDAALLRMGLACAGAGPPPAPAPPLILVCDPIGPLHVRARDRPRRTRDAYTRAELCELI